MDILDQRFTGKVVKEKLYRNTDSENKFLCIICDAILSQDIKNGYHNLCKHSTSHLKGRSEEEMKSMIEFLRGGQPALGFKANVTAFHRKVFKWLRVVTEDLMPFSIVESAAMRALAGNNESISRPTLVKYLQHVVKGVERNIKKELPDKFALVFDGWSENKTHYTAIFASYMISTGPNSSKCKKVLLSFSPFEDETDFSAISL
jgi:hypothetical protein